MKKVLLFVLVIIIMTGIGQNLFAHTPKWKAWTGKATYTTLPVKITVNLYSVSTYWMKKGKKLKKRKVLNFLVYDDLSKFTDRAQKVVGNYDELIVVGRKLTKTEKNLFESFLGKDSEEILKNIRKDNYLMAVGYKTGSSNYNSIIESENPNGK